MSMNFRAYIYFFACMILLAGCSKPAPKRELPPVRVEVNEVVQKDIPLFIETIGNVYETSLVQIRPQAQGILLKASVEQGQIVQEGDLLFEIDPKSYQAALDQAKANLMRDQALLEIAQITVKRNADLLKKDFISKLAYEQYEANVKQAEGQVEADKAAIQTAQINLNYTKIFSPISGKVSLYNVYPGNLVVINDPNFLIEIRQITPIDVRFTLPQRDFQELQKHHEIKDLPFQVFLPSEDDKPFTGTLYFFDNHIDLNTGTLLLKGRIANEDHVLWPGEFVRVRLMLKTEENAIVAPYSAIQIGQKGHYVFLVQPDQTVKVADVVVGQRLDSVVIIQSGLKAGDKVVTNGQLNLRSGAKVEVVSR